MSSNQTPWGPPRHHQSTRLTPISTAVAHDQRNTPSPSGSRPAFSPATSSFPSLPLSSSRHVGSRKSSAASSTSSPFSPSHAGQQPPVGQLLSSRVRTITSQQPSQLASAAAAAGGVSSSGGGAPRLVRASPSLSTSSTVGSPSTAINPTSASAHNQNLSRIVIAQVFLLLSQFGPVKDDKDRTKWETQAEQIRKVRPLSPPTSAPRFAGFIKPFYTLLLAILTIRSLSTPTAWRFSPSISAVCCRTMPRTFSQRAAAA